MTRVWDMNVASGSNWWAVPALALLVAVLAVTSAATGDAPPPCEPPAGYLPAEVDARIVGLFRGQTVEAGSVHTLRAEALDDQGQPWGVAYDWYYDGEHLGSGEAIELLVQPGAGEHRVTLVVTGADGSWTWEHVDVTVAREAPEPPPGWLVQLVRVGPWAALGLWLLLLRRQVAGRRGAAGRR